MLRVPDGADLSVRKAECSVYARCVAALEAKIPRRETQVQRLRRLHDERDPVCAEERYRQSQARLQAELDELAEALATKPEPVRSEPVRVAHSLSRRPRVAAMRVKRPKKGMSPEHARIVAELAAHGGEIEKTKSGYWTWPGCQALAQDGADEEPVWYVPESVLMDMVRAGWLASPDIRDRTPGRWHITSEARVAALLDGAPPLAEDGKGVMSDKLRDAIKAVGSMPPEHSRTFLPASSVLGGKSYGELPPIRPQPKPPPRVRSEDYLAFVRSHPCMSCGTRTGVQAHHHGPRAKGRKADDLMTVPLCLTCHTIWHANGVLPGHGCDTRVKAEKEIYQRMATLLVQFYRERCLIDALDEEATHGPSS